MQEYGALITMRINVETGFSLIEVMMAMVVLTVGLLALISMQGAFATGNANSRQITRATDLAGQYLETLNNADYDDSRLDDSNNDGMAGLENTGVNADHNATINQYPINYSVFWNVANNATTETKQVYVVVQWQQGGRNHELSLDWVKPNF